MRSLQRNSILIFLFFSISLLFLLKFQATEQHPTLKRLSNLQKKILCIENILKNNTNNNSEKIEKGNAFVLKFISRFKASNEKISFLYTSFLEQEKQGNIFSKSLEQNQHNLDERKLTMIKKILNEKELDSIQKISKDLDVDFKRLESEARQKKNNFCDT